MPAGQMEVPAPAVGARQHPRIEYKMTATGPGGVATCEADVMIEPVSPPYCEMKADPWFSYEPGKSTLVWTTQRATSVSLSMIKPRQGFQGSPTPVPITATPPLPDGKQTITGPPLEVGGVEGGTSAANQFTLKVTGPGGTVYCRASVFVVPGCQSLIDAFDFEVRTEKVAGIGGAAVAVLGFLGGPIGGAISTSAAAGATYVGQKFINAAEACNALAACQQKQGITGEVSVTNALGRVIGKCEWKAAGFGKYTP